MTDKIIGVYLVRYVKPSYAKQARISVKNLSTEKTAYVSYDHSVCSSQNYWNSLAIVLERQEIRNFEFSEVQAKMGVILTVFAK